MKKLLKKFHTGEKGFTLVETLVAISIFTVSILGFLSLLSQDIAGTNYSKKRAVASYLAEEGIEYTRNLRDTLVLYSTTSQAGWNAFNDKLMPSNSTLCAATNGCYFDDRSLSYSDTTMPMNDLIFDVCLTSTCSNAPLLYNSTQGTYNYISSATTTNSGFTRKIQATQVSANETKISSTVYWSQGSGNYSIVFTESLFNWVE